MSFSLHRKAIFPAVNDTDKLYQVCPLPYKKINPVASSRMYVRSDSATDFDVADI
jgi:hypothetical protein